MVTEQDLEQVYGQTKKKILPAKIITETAKFGAGFYVGFMDGQGIPVDPVTKYTLLATLLF